MKLLITGGYGNLGSWLVRHFSDIASIEIYVISRTKKSFLDQYQHTFIQCDISNLDDCKAKLTQLNFDYIIHAGSVNDTFEQSYAQNALLVNTLGTRNLLECINKNDLKNFIYLSTFHVYGASEGIITENTPTSPKNDYASTHLFAEYYVKQFHQTHNLPFTIIRLSNSYGCPIDVQSSKWYLILNDLARMAYVENKIVLKSNGKASRDFIWMGTVCLVFEKIVHLAKAPNDIFNLSAEKSFQLIKIANDVKEAAISHLNKSISVEVNNLDLSEHHQSLEVSAHKLKMLINYTPEVRFKEEAIAIFTLLMQNY